MQPNPAPISYIAASEAKDARIAELEREVAFHTTPTVRRDGLVEVPEWKRVFFDALADIVQLENGIDVRFRILQLLNERFRPLLDPPSPSQQSPQSATAQEQPEDHEDDRSAPRR
jgi:hypothetical protein